MLLKKKEKKALAKYFKVQRFSNLETNRETKVTSLKVIKEETRAVKKHLCADVEHDVIEL